MSRSSAARWPTVAKRRRTTTTKAKTRGRRKEPPMACPFLREADVRYCEVAPFRKMIRQTAREGAPERCATPDYMHCQWAMSRPGTPAGALRCPFLREAMVQYCEAAPVTRFIPHSDALQSFCQSEGFRYCD